MSACSRCLGYYLGGLFFAPLILFLFLSGYRIPFVMGLFFCWVLAGFAILDWASVRLRIRNGSNKVRVLTGFLLAVGVLCYLLLLDAGWLFRVGTLMLYGSVFMFFWFVSHRQDLKNMSVMVDKCVNPNRFWCCGPECCCMTPFTCCGMETILVCCLLPILCCCCLCPLCAFWGGTGFRGIRR